MYPAFDLLLEEVTGDWFDLPCLLSFTDLPPLHDTLWSIIHISLHISFYTIVMWHYSFTWISKSWCNLVAVCTHKVNACHPRSLPIFWSPIDSEHCIDPEQSESIGYRSIISMHTTKYRCTAHSSNRSVWPGPMLAMREGLCLWCMSYAVDIPCRTCVLPSRHCMSEASRLCLHMSAQLVIPFK